MQDLTSQLFFKYLLQQTSYTLLRQQTQTNKNVSVLVNQSTVLWLIIHFKLSQGFYKTQLVDIFAYETVSATLGKLTSNTSVTKSYPTVVYNFHNLLNQVRYFIFTTNATNTVTKSHVTHALTIDSITELYATSWWLEREIAELHGLGFSGKKDTRNLMLQYGDTSAPFRKSNPSAGFREIFYDSVSDFIAYHRLSFQG